MRRKVKGYDIELRTARQLFVWGHKFLGWPSHDNRWLYPEIVDWDWSEPDENWTIPAYIIWPVNATLNLGWEQHRDFEHHIRHMTGERYEFDWLTDPGAVTAVRRHIRYTYNYYVPHDQEAPVHEVSRWYSTREWEYQLAQWAAREYRLAQWVAERSMNGDRPA